MEYPPTRSCVEQGVHGGVEPVHDRAAPFLAFDEVGVLQGLEVVRDGARVAVQAGGEESTVRLPVFGERVEDAGLRGFGERREERQGLVPVGEKRRLPSRLAAATRTSSVRTRAWWRAVECGTPTSSASSGSDLPGVAWITSKSARLVGCSRGESPRFDGRGIWVGHTYPRE